MFVCIDWMFDFCFKLVEIVVVCFCDDYVFWVEFIFVSVLL